MIFKPCYRISIFMFLFILYLTELSMNTTKLQNLGMSYVISFFAIVIEFMQKKIPFFNGIKL